MYPAIKRRPAQVVEEEVERCPGFDLLGQLPRDGAPQAGAGADAHEALQSRGGRIGVDALDVALGAR